MTNTLDLERLWDAVKHGGISERSLDACEHLLENPRSTDLHLAILIVGVGRKPDDRRVKIMDMYLRNGKTDAERYSALRVLCQYWGLWDAYLQYLFSKAEPEAWESDYALADEATNLLGRYLCLKGEDKSAWGKLVEVYDDAIAIDDTEKADTAYNAMFVALRGEQEKLRTQLSRDATRDEGVIRAARERALLR
jgi:hypothetical protein